MGKGRIVSHISDGKYNITVNLNKEGITARIADIDRQILRLDVTDIPAAHLKYTQDNIRYAEAENNVNTAIAAFLAGTLTKAQLVNYVDRKNELYSAYVVSRREYYTLTLQREALVKEKAYLTEKKVDDPAVQAWCADLTTDLSGDVGLIEIPNERKHDPIIRPGHGGEAVYDAERDGQSTLIAGITPAATAHAYALLPGWQKWKPTYRVGVITDIIGDICDVYLAAAYSSAYELDVNNTRTLTGIDIVYMDCNGAAFEIGDRVVVEYQDQDYTRPRVIGFESNPRGCILDMRTIVANNYFRTLQGITGTVIASCRPAINIGDRIYGVAFNFMEGTPFHNYYIVYDFHAAKFLIITDMCFRAWTYNQPAEWVANNYYPLGGMAIDPSTGNLIACTFEGTFFDPWYGPAIYVFDGISNTVLNRIQLENGDQPNDICFDHDGNLIVSVWKQSNTTGYIRRYDGCTDTLLSSFAWPPIGPYALGPVPWGVTWCNGNLISFGGVPYQWVTQHDGFSATILSQSAGVWSNINQLVYPAAPTG